jgi:hypothetical protein
MVDTSALAGAYMAADSASLRGKSGLAPSVSKVDSTEQARGMIQRFKTVARILAGIGILQLLAVALSSFGVIVFAWKSLRKDIHILKKLGDSPLLPRSSDFRDLEQTVRDGSLELHERLYSWLRLLAVAGIWLLATSIVIGGAWYGHSSHVIPAWPITWAGLGLMCLTGLSSVWLLVRLSPLGKKYVDKLSWRSPLAGPEDNKILWIFEILGRAGVVLFGAGFFVFSLLFALDPGRALDLPLFYLRSSNIEGMLTPLVPLVASGLGFTAWCSWHLNRIRLLQSDTAFGAASAREEPPARSATTDPQEVLVQEMITRQQQAAAKARDCWNSLFLVFPHRAAYALLILVCLLAVWLAPGFGRTLEALTFPADVRGLTRFDWLLRLGIFASFLTTLWAVIRLLAIWGALRACLDELTVLPLVRAFKTLPPGLSHLARLSLPGRRSILASVQHPSIIQWHDLKLLYRDKILKDAQLPPELAAEVTTAMSSTNGYPCDPISGRPCDTLVVRVSLFQKLLAYLWALERPELPAEGKWKAAAEEAAALKKPAGADQKTKDRAAAANLAAATQAADAERVTLFRGKAEEYLATQVVGYAEWVVAHLRRLALFLLLSLLLTTVMLYSYPFPLQGLVRLLFTLTLLITVSSVIYVSLQMNKHEMLSLIAGTTAGVVNWDARLVTNLLTFGLVPLLTLLGSALPGLRNALLFWAEPLRKVIQP